MWLPGLVAIPTSTKRLVVPKLQTAEKSREICLEQVASRDQKVQCTLSDFISGGCFFLLPPRSQFSRFDLSSRTSLLFYKEVPIAGRSLLTSILYKAVSDRIQPALLNISASYNRLGGREAAL